MYGPSIDRRQLLATSTGKEANCLHQYILYVYVYSSSFPPNSYPRLSIIWQDRPMGAGRTYVLGTVTRPLITQSENSDQDGPKSPM